jgi:hypothetical protein
MGVYLNVVFVNETAEAKFFNVSVEILRAAKKRNEIWEKEANTIMGNAYQTGNWDAVDEHYKKQEGFDAHIYQYELGKLRFHPSCSQDGCCGHTSDKQLMENILREHYTNCSKPEEAYHAHANMHLLKEILWF